jgi:hypothetical protein
MADFAAILSHKADEVEKPRAVPEGEYFLNIRGHKARTYKDKEGIEVPILDFNYGITEPGMGVNKKELAARKIDISKKQLRSSFWLDDENLWRLTDFFEKAGLNVKGRSYNELLQEVVGREIIGVVTIRKSQIPGDDQEFNDVKSFKPAKA